MNKFAKLLDKFKKKNKIDQDEIDLEEIHDDEIEDDFDDISLDSHSDEPDLQEIPSPPKPETPTEIPGIPKVDSTKEINISQLKTQAENQTSDDDFEGEEFEDDSPEEILSEPSFTQSEVTGEIDLDDSKMGIKDRVDHMKMRVADRFRNLNKKDIYKTMKKPGEENSQVKKIRSKASSINWENLPNEILNSSHHQKVHVAFQIVIVSGMTLFLGNLIGYLFHGEPDYKSSKRSGELVIDDSKLLTMDKISKIKNANVFRTNKVKAPIKDNTPVRDEPQVCLTAQRKSSLPIKLMNTIVLQDSVKSIASVSIRSNSKLKRLREGDKIANLAEIGRINGKSLIIKNLKTKVCEEIISKEEKKGRGRKNKRPSILSKRAAKSYKKKVEKVEGIETDGVNFKIKKAFLKDKMKDINALLTQARGIKISNPDGTISFKIVDIQPGSIYSYLGIQNGDVISQINGEPIQELNEVMKLFGSMSNLSKLSLGLGRSGEDVTQNYNID